MVFWLSVLVFIAGIMTYMFFPRSDQYALNVFQEEGNVVTFVNQHQGAKDLMYQMISWNPTDPNNTGIYALPDIDSNNRPYLQATIPHIMQDDVYEGETPLNVNPDRDDSDGNFTSAIVCLESCESGANCIEGKRMTTCPSDEQYVVTYGYFPEWWRDGTHRKQAWFRALLKRTHGSTVCGVLTDQGVFNGNTLYSINNSQRFIGYQILVGRKVVPPALTNTLNAQGIDTCEPRGSCSDALRDLLFCMTPFKNPYRETPVFHWDTVNNNKTAHQNGLGQPLVGFLDDNEIQVDNSLGAVNRGLPNIPYTLTGVVQKTEENAEKTLVTLNENNNITITQTCNAANCTLSVTNGPTVGAIPLNKGYSFTYTATNDNPRQILTVYYNQYVNASGTVVTKANPNDPWPDGIKKEMTNRSGNTNTAGPALFQPKISRNVGTPNINDLRLYRGSLADKDAEYNAKVDLKRFGL